MPISADNLKYSQPNSELNWATWLFLVVLFVFVGIMSWRVVANNITDPANQVLIENDKRVAAYLAANPPVEEIDLRTTDTDGDGLTDYDESEFFGTSPYLLDSDSDGLSDYEEVMAGSDPTCARGDAYCEQEQYEFASEDWEGQSEDDVVSLFLAGEMTADQVRQVLVASGLEASMLAGISDTMIMQIYRTLLANPDQPELAVEQIMAALPASEQAKIREQAGTNLDESMLKQLLGGEVSDQQLRQILISAGFSATLLEKISDQALRQFYQQTVAQIKGEDNLANMSITDLRFMLVAAGMDSDEVDSLSEEQLRQLYQQLLQKVITP